MTLLTTIARTFLIGMALWLLFIMPPFTLASLLSGLAFHDWWLTSTLALPLPILLLRSAFRSRRARWRWWVFQYLGVSAIGFSAALCAIALSLLLEPKTAGLSGLLVLLIFLLIGWRAAHRIHIAPLTIISEKIETPMRLVQISDVHIGSRKPAFLKKVIQQVDAQEPDALLITGDLLDENVHADALLPLSGRNYPVFYCSGNHERYVSYRQVLSAIASHGVNVLNDTMATLQQLHIIGIEDRQRVELAKEALADVHDPNVVRERFTILLYHQPDLWDKAVEQGIDLMLCGHTHNGQIWPFGWLVRTRYPRVAGHYQSATSHLFVSQGTGTWGPIMRFGTRCEMTVIDLKSMTYLHPHGHC